jgi:hypothetical protein
VEWIPVDIAADQMMLMMMMSKREIEFDVSGKDAVLKSLLY